MALLVPIMAVGTFGQLLPPFIIQHIIDRIVSPAQAFRGLGQIFWLVAGLLGARLMIWACEVGRAWIGVWLGARVSADLRAQFFRCLERLPLRFFDQWQVGLLMSRFTNDASRVEEFLSSGVPLLIVNSLMLIGILGYLFYTSWALTVCVLLPAPLIILGASLIWDRLRDVIERQAASMARLSAHLSESLAGIRVVKAFAQEQQELVRFGRRNEQLCEMSASVERRSFAFFSLIYFLMNLGAFVVWYVGGRRVLGGELTLGELTAVISYLWMLYWPLQWLGQLNTSLAQAITGAQRIFEIVDSPEEDDNAKPGKPLRHMRGTISFRKVTFGYDPGKPVLHDIDFEVGAGEVVAVIGKSGAGKTTMMNLLCRFYDVDRGSIAVDGMDLREICIDDLRNQIGVVLQDSFLFNGTIADNIRYGKPDASLDEVISAATAANAHCFIVGRNDGYDTILGEKGSRLSGGEKQRITIARTLLRDPKILILDEATSSLDIETEHSIQEALSRLAQSRTTLIVAHRLSSIRKASRVIVLDAGRIVETGTYQELIARQGVFYHLATTQKWAAHESIVAPPLPFGESRKMTADTKQIRLSRDPCSAISLTIAGEQTYDRFRIVCAAPLSNPDRYICFLDSEGREICMVPDPAVLDEQTRQIVLEELKRQYMTAVIERIDSVRTETGTSYFRVITDRGPREFVLLNNEENVRWLSEQRVLLVDVDGNRFEVPKMSALDRRSARTLWSLR
jgi:ATP-binding cassette subfamily B protein